MSDEDGDFIDNDPGPEGDFNTDDGYYDHLYQQQNAWKTDPLLHDCPVASFGNYQPANDVCDFECPWRNACLKSRDETRIQASAEAWQRLFCLE